MPDIPHLPNTVSWADVRASIEWRRVTLIAEGRDPDEGPLFEKAWREIEAEKAARRKAYTRPGSAR